MLRIPKRTMLSLLTATFVVAATSPSLAQVNQIFSFSGQPGTQVEFPFFAEGSISDFTINATFDNLGNYVFASDLLFAVVAPNGNAVEFGGGERRHVGLHQGWEVHYLAIRCQRQPYLRSG